jgi:peptidylprolyl isomerase
LSVTSFHRVAIVVLISYTLAGCSDQSDALGRAGETTIDAGEVQRILDALPEQSRTAVRGDKEALERLVRSELIRRALLAEAREAKLESDQKVSETLNRVRDDALMRLWLARQGQVADDYPSEDELKLAYQSNAAALAPPAQLRVAQIFIAAPDGIAPAQFAVAMRKAADVGSKIPDGDFAALARQYSEHAESAARGGDVGLLPANQMLPEIVAAVRSLEVGSSVGPVKTSQGLHYVKLLEKVVPPTPTFDEAREPLRNALRTRRAQEMEQAYLSALSNKLDVAVNQLALAEIGAAGKSEETKP